MKNFLKSSKGKSGRFVAKNIIVLAVLVAVCTLGVWSWLTKGQTSFANGINITAKGDGVQVSWDGKSYYDDLTARDDSGIIKDQTGPAKNLCGVDGNPLSLNLITGDGINFFEPYINRRTGQTPAQRRWKAPSPAAASMRQAPEPLRSGGWAPRPWQRTRKTPSAPPSDRG